MQAKAIIHEIGRVQKDTHFYGNISNDFHCEDVQNIEKVKEDLSFPSGKVHVKFEWKGVKYEFIIDGLALNWQDNGDFNYIYHSKNGEVFELSFSFDGEKLTSPLVYAYPDYACFEDGVDDEFVTEFECVYEE